MIRKTEGIVLRTLSYQDSNLITTIYTREMGIRSFILKGYRSGRARNRFSYFQPLSIIELVFFYKEHQNLSRVNESKLAVLLHETQVHPVKLSLGLAIIEIFYDCVKEEEANLPLYQFLRDTITQLDEAEHSLIHIFIHYLLHLTRYLGFLPLDESGEALYASFDLRQGIILPAQNKQDEIALLLRRFLHSGREAAQQISFDQSMKRRLIKTLFDYYRHHIEGFKYPQTLKVFAEVFN